MSARPVPGVDRHLTKLEQEILTPEQKAHRMSELEWEELQAVDAICDQLDMAEKRRKERGRR